MFVAEGAKARLMKKRGEAFYEESALPAVKEAKRLGISLEELQAMIKRGYENGD